MQDVYDWASRHLGKGYYWRWYSGNLLYQFSHQSTTLIWSKICHNYCYLVCDLADKMWMKNNMQILVCEYTELMTQCGLHYLSLTHVNGLSINGWQLDKWRGCPMTLGATWEPMKTIGFNHSTHECILGHIWPQVAYKLLFL